MGKKSIISSTSLQRRRIEVPSATDGHKGKELMAQTDRAERSLALHHHWLFDHICNDFVCW